MTYCHVCLCDVPTSKVATCRNGHSCCEKHHIQRVKAIYESGEYAFDDPDPENGSGGAQGQMCFMCRCSMRDECFSQTYFKMLRVCLLVEMPKASGGYRIDNETIEAAIGLMKIFNPATK